MGCAAGQYKVVDPAARLFHLNASMFAVPLPGHQRDVESSASVHVRPLRSSRWLSAPGREMTQSETVTLFNDPCIMAPATSIDRAIVWDTSAERTVCARFANAGHTIDAVVSFNDSGELTNRVSNDRFQASPRREEHAADFVVDPAARIFVIEAVRLASSGEGRWQEHSAEYAYIELTTDDVQYNVSPTGQ
jgi:hypothetical protein